MRHVDSMTVAEFERMGVTFRERNYEGRGLRVECRADGHYQFSEATMTEALRTATMLIEDAT